jgi:hypothetical protein
LRSQNQAGQPDSPRSDYHRQTYHDFAVWLYQEKSKNTEARNRFGKTKIENITRQAMNSQREENPHIGSNLDAFLSEEAILDEVTAVATKRVIAWQISEGMSALKLSKTAMTKKCSPAELPLIGCWMQKIQV